MAQLKQENDELRAELAAAREQPPAAIEQPEAATEQKPNCADEIGIERNILRQEIHALQVRLIFLFLLYQLILKIIRSCLVCASQTSVNSTTGPLHCKV